MQVFADYLLARQVVEVKTGSTRETFGDKFADVPAMTEGVEYSES